MKKGGVDLAALLAAHAVPGAVVARLCNGEWTWEAAGLRDIERNLPVEIDTPFEIGSLAKPLFACAVLQLAEDGLLALDVPVDEYLTRPFLPGEKRARDHHPAFVDPLRRAAELAPGALE